MVRMQLELRSLRRRRKTPSCFIRDQASNGVHMGKSAQADLVPVCFPPTSLQVHVGDSFNNTQCTRRRKATPPRGAATVGCRLLGRFVMATMQPGEEANVSVATAQDPDINIKDIKDTNQELISSTCILHLSRELPVQDSGTAAASAVWLWRLLTPPSSPPQIRCCLSEEGVGVAKAGHLLSTAGFAICCPAALARVLQDAAAAGAV